MAALHNVCLEIISFCMITMFLKVQLQANYFLMIHGRAATRFSVKDIKDHLILIYNRTIQKQKNIHVIQIGREKILAQRLTKAAIFILFLMKQMINIISTHLRVIRKHLLQIFLLLLKKKHTMGVYLSGRNEVRLIDLKTNESKTIIRDEIWGLENGNVGFSPNDEYVVFTAYRNFEQDIFVYNIKQNKTIDLTNTAIKEKSPLW